MQENLFPLINFSSKNFKGKYKETSLAPVMYFGAKGRAANVFMKYMPAELPPRIVAPFLGMAGFELFLNKEYGVCIEGADVDPMLVNFWNAVIYKNEELVEKLKYWEHRRSRAVWRQTRQKFMQMYKRKRIRKCLAGRTCVWAAAAYHYVLRYSYGGIMGGKGCALSKMSSGSYDEYLKTKIANMKLEKFYVREADFAEMFELFPDEFFYLDPPYVLQNENRSSHMTGNHLYVFNKSFEHERIADCIKRHNGKFMLSYNNCEMIREMYKGFNQYFPVWRNSIKQPKLGRRRTYNSDEILITNY